MALISECCIFYFAVNIGDGSTNDAYWAPGQFNAAGGGSGNGGYGQYIIGLTGVAEAKLPTDNPIMKRVTIYSTPEDAEQVTLEYSLMIHEYLNES